MERAESLGAENRFKITLNAFSRDLEAMCDATVLYMPLKQPGRYV